ncbi:MAG: lipoprotein signal peptidase [Neisseria sp.]|nr:lipoprotein signal peptidase [Neisseria sp.]
MRPLQKSVLRRISLRCAPRNLAYLHDMPALPAVLSLRTAPQNGLLQRSQTA